MWVWEESNFQGEKAAYTEGNTKERVINNEIALSKVHCAWRRMEDGYKDKTRPGMGWEVL